MAITDIGVEVYILIHQLMYVKSCYSSVVQSWSCEPCFSVSLPQHIGFEWMELHEASAELQDELIIGMRCAEARKHSLITVRYSCRYSWWYSNPGNPHTLLHYYTGKKKCVVILAWKEQPLFKRTGKLILKSFGEMHWYWVQKNVTFILKVHPRSVFFGVFYTICLFPCRTGGL